VTRDHDDALPVVRAAHLESTPSAAKWLVRDIWTEQGVGFIGGAPKCCKSWLGLDLAISVASSTPALDRFAVDAAGSALVYLAEDALPAVRDRIAGICTHRTLDIDRLDLHVITAPVVRLDTPHDQRRLARTLAEVRPRIVLLDPLVRLHACDENSSTEISALLGFLRHMQREYATAIVLVHHLGKRQHAQLGQALRGSGDLHAWSDDNAFLVRDGDRLTLSFEHRTATSLDPIGVQLVARADGSAVHLAVVRGDPADAQSDRSPLDAEAPTLARKILDALRASAVPMTRGMLRERLRVNNQRLGNALAELERREQVIRTGDGWNAFSPTR
jgi:RecA-family ATPase